MINGCLNVSHGDQFPPNAPGRRRENPGPVMTRLLNVLYHSGWERVHFVCVRGGGGLQMLTPGFRQVDKALIDPNFKDSILNSLWGHTRFGSVWTCLRFFVWMLPLRLKATPKRVHSRIKPAPFVKARSIPTALRPALAVGVLMGAKLGDRS